MPRPWETDWERREGWSRGGGQGVVFPVRRTGCASPEEFVLKELKSPKNPERRARMRREVVALQTLSHTALPRVVDHNTDEYEDPRAPLYAVFEYIQGPTLEEFVKCRAGASLLAEARDLVLRLLDVVETCHAAGIGHRDIKPDNIVLRAGSPSDPVLIDFGQTFNIDEMPDSATYVGQQVGNRFLALPEHATTSGNKRDLRSDIAFCCGIFFYVMTGAEPGILLDEHQRMPHQRDVPRAVLDRLPEPARSRVLGVFDVGFRFAIGERWQSVEALRNSLSSLERVVVAGQDAGVQRLKARAKAAAGNKAVLDALGAVMRRVEAAAQAAAERLGEGYGFEAERRAPSMAQGNAWIRCAVVAHMEGRTVSTPFLISATGDEIVVEELLQPEGREPRGRVPLASPGADPGLDEAVAEAVLRRTVEALAG